MNRRYFILLVLFAVLFSSCTTFKSISSLKAGKLPSESSEDPVLVFQVEVIDHTGILAKERSCFLPKVNFQKIDEYEIAENIEISSVNKNDFWSGKLKEPGWKTEGDASVFRENFYTSSKPGEYYIKDINIFLGSTSSSGYNQTTTTSYTQFFYPEIGFEMESNNLYVLGTIRLEIIKIDGESFPNYTFTSNTSLDNNIENIFALTETFLQEYPNASDRYDNGITTASAYPFIMFDFSLNDYGYSSNSSDWNSYESDVIDYLYYGNKYVLKKKVDNNTYNYMQCNRTFDLSDSFEITWESQLINGDTEGLYGLMIGDDPENCYFFYLNGSGTTGISWLVNNEWRENPAYITGEIDNSEIFSLRRNRLIGTGTTIEYYIDEVLIGRTETSLNDGPQMMAFFISGTSMVEMDNLFIRSR